MSRTVKVLVIAILIVAGLWLGAVISWLRAPGRAGPATPTAVPASPAAVVVPAATPGRAPLPTESIPTPADLPPDPSPTASPVKPPPHPSPTAAPAKPPARATPTVPPSPAGPATWLRPGYKAGIQLLLDDGRNHWLPKVWPEHVRAAGRIVGEGGYVLQLIRLDDLNVRRWQPFMDLCAREHVIPIIRLAGAFDHERKWWIAPPKDADGEGYTEVAGQYARFLAELRWPTTPHYAIVGNEPNRGDEWSNRPDPAEYARFLRDVGRALHGVGITVLGPALDLYCPHSNGRNIAGYQYIDAESFMDGMIAAVPDVFDVIDVWAAHAYPLDPFRLDPSRQTFQIDYANGAANPRHVDPPDGIYNRGINSYRWELWKLEQLIGPRAASLPVFITESGWRHAVTQDAQARDAVHAELSFETQSAYLDLAFNGNGGRYPGLPESGWTAWNDDPRVVGVILFALGGFPRDWGHTNWVRLDGQGRVTEFYPITLAAGP